MEKRGFVLNDEALLHHQRVEFAGESNVDPGRLLVVKYPGAFPSMPPRAYAPGRLLPRHHRPGSYELCIFGRERERWSAGNSGTSAIDEAEDVLRLYASGSPPVAEDDVPEPASALYPYEQHAAILVPPGISQLDFANSTVPVFGTFWLRFGWSRGAESNKARAFSTERGMILRAELGGTSAEANAPYLRWFAGQPEFQKCPLIRLPSPPPYFETDQEIAAWLQQFDLKRKARWIGFMFPEQSGSVSGKRVSWLVLHASPDGTYQYLRAFSYRPAEREARVPGLGGLATKKVVFIGCGSMGSKIAVALTQTGLIPYCLVDPDIFKPENAVRHELGPDHFGALKVKALADRLIHVNPDTDGKIVLVPVMIGDDNPPHVEEALLNFIASADLVIDTTGSHQVSHWVDRLCHELGIPAMYATVTNGAWGGDIVRVIPGKTACWRCWDHHYRDDGPPAAPAPETGVYAPGCEQPTFTGTTYELGVVANLAAWMAVETLLRDEPGRKDFAGDYIRWAARLPDGTPQLAPEVLQVNRRVGCGVCNPE